MAIRKRDPSLRKSTNIAKKSLTASRDDKRQRKKGGFKLHIVINDKGEKLDFLFTQDNIDDREPLKNKNIHDKLLGNLFADKG